MPSSSWARSGGSARAARSAARRSGPRPDGSWSIALRRARDAWDDLTGGPTVDLGPDVDSIPAGELRPVGANDGLPHRYGYSTAAARAILDTAIALWPDVAASMAGPEDDGEG